MKIVVILALVIAAFIDPLKAMRINEAKRNARQAYEKGDYEAAIGHYRHLTDSLGVEDDEVLMNLAHAYYHTRDSVHTRDYYQRVTRSSDPRLRSTAYQQLGVIANAQGHHQEALDFFKEALRSDPTNDEARYNYELVKQKLEEQKKQEQQNQDKQDKKEDQDKDQQQNKQDQRKDQKQDQQEKEQQQKEQQQKQEQQKQQDQQQQQKSEEQQKNEEQKADPSLSEKLKEMQISEEKAKMILEAMKNNEVQYLQQNKRKATRPRDKGKPDW